MATKSREFDIVVIGAGPGGYTAAIRAGQLGLKAALVEKEDSLGGVCLNWGCIPTKALLKQAEIYRLFQRAGEFGFEVGDVGFDWKKIMAGQLTSGVAYLMSKNGVEVFTGRGLITPARKVEVRDGDDQVGALLECRHVIIATGGRPRSIPGVEIDGKRILSSQEAMITDERPDSMIIVGAGAIGIEFAYFYNAFGTRVKVLEALPQVLPREDEEVAGLLEQSLQKQGIEIETGVRVEAIDPGEDQVVGERIAALFS